MCIMIDDICFRVELMSVTATSPPITIICLSYLICRAITGELLCQLQGHANKVYRSLFSQLTSLYPPHHLNLSVITQPFIVQYHDPPSLLIYYYPPPLPSPTYKGVFLSIDRTYSGCHRISGPYDHILGS